MARKFPQVRLPVCGGSGWLTTRGRCWHRSTDCSRYRATTNRQVTIGPVVQMTAGKAKELGYGLCSGCLKRLTSA
jgi:hypothetical protein